MRESSRRGVRGDGRLCPSCEGTSRSLVWLKHREQVENSRGWAHSTPGRDWGAMLRPGFSSKLLCRLGAHNSHGQQMCL